MKRRDFIWLKGFAALYGAGLLTGLYSWQIEPFWLEIVHQKMAIKNLPKQLIDKTLMQISDTHVGDKFDRNYLIESFKKAQLLNPDFVVYTGDLVNYESKIHLEQMKEVYFYAVKGKIGTAGVLGNHDYGKNWNEHLVADKITAIAKNSGINILRNEQQNFGGLNIIGLDDMWGTNFFPKKIMKSVNKNYANLVLSHNPDVVDKNVWYNYKGWILSGHTHGGQVKPPFLNPPILPCRNKNYTAGLINLKDGRKMYINRALGHIAQVRFNVRPEITLFTLAAV